MRINHDRKAFSLLLLAVAISLFSPYVFQYFLFKPAATLSTIELLINIVVLIGIFIVEAIVTFRLTRKEASRDFANSKLNGLTSAFLLVSFGVLPPVLDSYFFHWFTFNSFWLFFIGNALLISGAIVRVVAIRELRGFFNHSLVLYDSHQVVSTGIYSKIRHPAYLGTLLMFVGFSLSYKSIASLFLVGFVLLYIFKRIRAEEAMLESRLFDTYRHYKQKTFCLIPFVI
ncbi:MAG: hypothetical protein B0W54_21465 [Cellvibrio sp. 79]|nr:MAG: hypothetical protein B0W54_21465 [Cellvibrio sp. 79]